MIRIYNQVWPQLFHVRFPLLTVAAGALMVLMVPQVRELFFLIGTGWHAVFAYLATFFLALAVWYSARTVYRFRFDQWETSDPAVLPGFKQWAPRIMGTLVPVLMALGCLLAAGDVSAPEDTLKNHLRTLAVAFVVLAVLVALVVVYRRPVTQWSARNVPGFGALAVPDYDKQDRGLKSAWSQLANMTKAVFLGGLAINLVFTLVAINAPHWLASLLGPIATVMLAGAFFAITGSLITFLGTKSRVPLLTLIILFGVALHMLRWNDNHYVRQCPEMNSNGDLGDCSPYSPSAPGLAAYWTDWVSKTDPERPIYLVSAEGGGIRAAVWTAMVLSKLNDVTDGEFSKHLFAASGVSGGSLGIATHVGLAKMGQAGALNENQETTAAEILTQDFLTPNLVNLFFVDTLQRLLPGRLVEDRGQRLEESWAWSWAQHFRSQPEFNRLLGSPFVDLYSDDSIRLPLALLNATVVQTGDRFIQAPFRLLEPAAFAQVFPGARDSHDYLHPELPLNAAVHNSARFTYVSPAGTVANATNNGESADIQVVDGGYFENSGTVTLGEMYRWVSERLDETDQPDRPITVIHISNDATVLPLLPESKDACPGQDGTDISGRVAGEGSAPLVALLKTRNARAENARQELARNVLADNNAFMHFRLCEGEAQIPLGWALSEQARDEMRRQLGRDGEMTARYIKNHRDQKDIVAATFRAR